jgi:hypothetical protein
VGVCDSLWFPAMGSFLRWGPRRRGAWALSEPSAVLLWQLGIAWSSLAAVADAATGRRMVLSELVLLGPVCVFFTGRWLRTALAGAWATGLVLILGVPDGIWGSRLQIILIVSAVFVAAVSTLALIVTVRACLYLTVTASLAAACGSPTTPRRPAVSAARPVPCRQQYQDWTHGAGFTQYRGLQADVKAVRTAEKSGNAVAMRSAMNKLMPAVVGNGNIYPPPHCADPSGLYGDYVNGIFNAGYEARTAKGLSGLQKAATQLDGLKNIQSQLAAEANRVLAKP